MKKDFFIIIIIAILFCSLSCNKQNKIEKTENSFTLKDNLTENGEDESKKTVTDSLINYTTKKISSNPIVKVDTTIQKLDISYIIKDNSDIIVQPIIDGFGTKDTLYYADRSLYLTLKRDNRPILLNKKFDKKDFSTIIPAYEQKDLQIMFFTIKKVKLSESIFSLTICVPDSYDCYFIEMTILDSGKIIIEEDVEESEIDNI